MGFDFRTNTPWQLVSWMNATDPSPGEFILKMETYNVPDFFMGCARMEPLSCSSNKFWKEPSMKVPDTENATSRGNISLDSCKKLCVEDCSCVAFAVINGPYGCITWRGELLDLRSFTDGDGGDDLYIRLPGSSTSNWKKLVWAIVTSALLGIILLCSVGILVRRRRNRALQFPNAEKGSISTLDVLPSYDLHTIKAATNDFSEENKLGEGGFGVVYKCQLDDRQKIAVKKLSRYSSQSPNEFQNDLSVIAKLQHRNLVVYFIWIHPLQTSMMSRRGRRSSSSHGDAGLTPSGAAPSPSGAAPSPSGAIPSPGCRVFGEHTCP